MTITRTAPVALVAAALMFAPRLAAPAAAVPDAATAVTSSDRGLFGSQDPTYDGVYRQGLAIAGLVSVESAVPRQAVRWLLRQQCANGAYLSYRPDLSGRCPAPDPDAFTGPDSNSTAMAALALRAIGERKAARRATRYLRTMANRDGGFAYYRGGPSDANSTGLALAVLQGLKRTKAVRADIRAGSRYLRRLQLRCDAPVARRGLTAYQATSPVANLLASAQAAVGLVTTLPIPENAVVRQRTGRLKCANGRAASRTGVREALLHGLTRQLVRGGGLLPNDLGPGKDYTATAQTVLALTAARRSSKQVRLAVRGLRKAAATYAGVPTTPDAGRLGTLLLVADAAGAKPRRFGGVDLVASLRGIRR